MPGNASPTVRRRRLAAELRRLRERAGLTGDEVAGRLAWSPSKVSRYELARTGLKLDDVGKLLDLYGVDAGRQDELLSLARDASKKGWWEEYSDALPEDYLALIGLEAEAQRELSWHLEVVPGLLQTEAYARQINSQSQLLNTIPPSQIERSVQARLMRQQRLTSDPPLELSVVLDEGVLLRKLADKEVMREQLERLIELAQLPAVSLRVLRLSNKYPIIMNSFEVLQFGTDRDALLPDVVWTEHMQNALYFDGEADTYPYRVLFGILFEHSLGPDESIDLIAQTARKAWS